MADLKKALLKNKIDCIFCQNNYVWVYDVSFINSQNRTILNYSRLDKKFQPMCLTTCLKILPTEKLDSPCRVSAHMLDPQVSINQQMRVNLCLYLLVQHDTDSEEEQLAKVKQLEEKIRQKKNKW